MQVFYDCRCIQNIKFKAFESLQRGFYGIPYIGYFIAADVFHDWNVFSNIVS